MAKKTGAKQTEEFRAMSDLELDAKVLDLKRDCFTLQNLLVNKTSDVKPHQVRDMKKDIARLLTIRSERQFGLRS